VCDSPCTLASVPWQWHVLWLSKQTGSLWEVGQAHWVGSGVNRACESHVSHTCFAMVHVCVVVSGVCMRHCSAPSPWAHSIKGDPPHSKFRLARHKCALKESNHHSCDTPGDYKKDNVTGGDWVGNLGRSTRVACLVQELQALSIWVGGTRSFSARLLQPASVHFLEGSSCAARFQAHGMRGAPLSGHRF